MVESLDAATPLPGLIGIHHIGIVRFPVVSIDDGTHVAPLLDLNLMVSFLSFQRPPYQRESWS
jgi:hypothetical protein